VQTGAPDAGAPPARAPGAAARAWWPQAAAPRVSMAPAGQVHGETCVPRRRGPARGAPVASRRGGERRAQVGAGILTSGRWERPAPRCTRAPHGDPPPGAGGPQGGRLPGGWGPQAAAAPSGQRRRRELRLGGRGAGAGVQGARRPEAHRQPLPSAQGGPPGPRGRGRRRRRPGLPARAPAPGAPALGRRAAAGGGRARPRGAGGRGTRAWAGRSMPPENGCGVVSQRLRAPPRLRVLCPAPAVPRGRRRRGPQAVSSGCSRRPPASAALPLPAAPEARR
jgi:hypothetical protein